MEEFIKFGMFEIKKSSVVWIRVKGMSIEMGLINGHTITETYKDSNEYFDACGRLSIIFEAEITG